MPVILSPEGGVGASVRVLAVADHLGILRPWPPQHWGGRWACLTSWHEAGARKPSLRCCRPILKAVRCVSVLSISLVFLFTLLYTHKPLIWKGCVGRSGKQRCLCYSRAENQPLTWRDKTQQYR